ncbi:MAG: RluA family pseudouridine synthase [Patescibacteria group bacterium]|jgi:23S rRNA pseudouridine1911/1915/1917 synthase
MIPKLFEDENIIIVDKPAGLVVHPGAGEHSETLTGWFTQNYPETTKFSWPDLKRPGIIHRLDKDTSGLIILAKNPRVLGKLQNLFQTKKVTKKYLALVFGKLEKEKGEISGLIGRDPHARRKQIAKEIHFDFEPGKVREAKTHYRVLKTFRCKVGKNAYDLTLIEAILDTGRMHQIRVHFKSIGHPLIGDQTYNIKHSRRVSKALGLNRQFLHAYKLSFKNPFNNKIIDLESPLPEDLNKIITRLQ